MAYRAPVSDIAFTMRHVAGLDAAAAEGLYGDLTPDLAMTILEEAGRQLGKRGPAGTYYRLRPGLGVALAVSAGPAGP